MEPLFEPLGFDWRINIGVLASLSAREVFVSTIGQVAAADDPEDPVAALRSLSRDTHGRAGAPLFDPPTLAALLVFFAYALQCTSTIAVMRRESGGWRWPLTAFVSYSALAWLGAWIAHTVVAAGWSG